MKRCSKCGVEKEEKEFPKNNKCKGGFAGTCKKCRYEKTKELRMENPEFYKKKQAENRHRWYLNHRDEQLLYAKKHPKPHKRNRNREKENEAARKRRKENPEIRKAAKEYAIKHRDDISRNRRNCYWRDVEKSRSQGRRYAKKRRESGKISEYKKQYDLKHPEKNAKRYFKERLGIPILLIPEDVLELKTSQIVLKREVKKAKEEQK